MRHDTAVLIGSGGMGKVFKAWDPTLERHVAIKYLRYNDPELVERLLREARAQARVDHPGVCDVYEVGVDEGRPFIAMQYVDGHLLHEATAEFSLEQKVLVVKQVTEAVQAAHAQGLIHRDLKPGNIIIGETGDGEIRPYVLDFGIAREQEVPGVTLTGQVIGTPGYLSPEQARGEGETLDRRSDIFSLGVILYELLGGASPFSGDSDVEVLIALLEQEPAPLRRHAPQVPRDLETVAMTCLEKDPDRRYPSARELAEDLGRFLAGEPVEARPVSLVQRLARKARKHRVAASLLLASALTVIVLLGVLVSGWVKYTADLRHERNLALEAQRIAEEKESETEEFADFLVSVFEVSDPSQARGEEITAREILDQGAERVVDELADKPLIQARLMGVIGFIYTKLGLVDQATPLLQQAVEIVNAIPEADDRALIDSHVRLADLYIRSGEFDKAASLLQPMAETAEDTLGPNHLEVALTLDSLGRAYIHQGRYREAEVLLSRALNIAKASVGPEHIETATIENDLAVVLQRLGEFERADALFRHALATRERELGADDPRVATTLNNYGDFLRTRGLYEEAIPLLERALEIRERVLGPEHPRVASICNNLALAYKKLEKYDRSEHLYLRALEIRENTYGPDHPRTASVLANLAGLYKAIGNVDQAETSYRRAITIYEQAQPAHPTLASVLYGFADLLRHEGRPGEAERLLEQALVIQEDALGPEHVLTARSRKSLALTWVDQGRSEDAADLLERTIAVQE